MQKTGQQHFGDYRDWDVVAVWQGCGLAAEECMHECCITLENSSKMASNPWQEPPYFKM